MRALFRKHFGIALGYSGWLRAAQIAWLLSRSADTSPHGKTDCSGGIPCTTCPDTGPCGKTGCVRQVEHWGRPDALPPLTETMYWAARGAMGDTHAWSDDDLEHLWDAINTATRVKCAGGVPGTDLAQAAWCPACRETVTALCPSPAECSRNAGVPVVRECCNGECGWKGQTDRMLGGVGPLCPECGEVTEPTAGVQPSDGGQR